MKIVTADEMREIDRRAIEEFGIPGIVLMENAGRGAADAIGLFTEESDIERIVIIAGKGNNGGDGFRTPKTNYAPLDVGGLRTYFIRLLSSSRTIP